MTARYDVATRLRLASGLVLMAFVVTHLVNHMLGLVSLDAMERGRIVFLDVWRSVPGTAVLYTSAAVHMALVLARLYRRRSLRMPAWQAAQIVLGLLIPPLLVLHVLGTRGMHQCCTVDDSYLYVLLALWPDLALRQTALLLIAWAHGCAGVHFWLRVRPWYERLRPWLAAMALLVPTLALLGFVEGGREAVELARADPAFVRVRAEIGNWPGADRVEAMYAQERAIVVGFAVLVGLILATRELRARLARRRNRVRLFYPDGRTVAVEPGLSVLEASRANGIPHASVCGGRGRCSTCRVRVGRGADGLPPPSDDETWVLRRLGAPEDVRLACQLRPSGDLSVTPLLPAVAGPRDVWAFANPGQGVEREIAVLFSDLRGFTQLSEGRLPYDVVFMLNQYFKAMGAAIERSGGRIDKFIGDGIMALFGVDSGPEEASRAALAAARAMGEALDELNGHLADELDEPMRMGIGIHNGRAIVGQMGYGSATSMTAIGDTVNVASRLEALSKEHGAQLVVSDRLARRAGVDLGDAPLVAVEVRGRRRKMNVRIIAEARALPQISPISAGRAPGPGWLARIRGPLRSRAG